MNSLKINFIHFIYVAVHRTKCALTSRPKWQYKTLYEYSLLLYDSLASLRCQFLAQACEHVLFFFCYCCIGVITITLKHWQFYAIKTVRSNKRQFTVVESDLGVYVCVWRNITRLWMLSGSCKHSLMYFNAFFTLTKNVQVITCCFQLGRREKLLANKFIHFIHAYLFDATALICGSFMWTRVMQKERDGRG